MFGIGAWEKHRGIMLGREIVGFDA